ncbi:hypothetical protein Pst134EB_026600 [Puccinia striiformis f. sp. tritici]|uniref:Uncharacterized protein n=1 Tax=Puccinia striiformis f. sp. tritici PST-78 TaxID=1165861 RepID=A0A0L0V6B8_9BASI|nr:hypothetical protein Pst134EB_026600 [Puccinia striiformis f. sp. tritici]KNE94524.1 hypothetical protein PSTG_12170 [Puccinia striiformis f. sp. tritici PST-78]
MNKSDLESTLLRSQTPTQESYLNQSAHNPNNGFLKTISKIFASPNPDGRIYITADKVETLSPLLEIKKIASVQKLNMVGKITDCHDAFEKTLNSISDSHSNPPPPTKSWVAITKKGLTNHLHSTTVLNPPSNRILNEFKPAFFPI